MAVPGGHELLPEGAALTTAQPEHGQPAVLARPARADPARAGALARLVLTLAGDQICAMTRFETSMLAYFGLPRTLVD
jgi:RNA polymerase sigma-70 factor (ECF subfamily)